MNLPRLYLLLPCLALATAAPAQETPQEWEISAFRRAETIELRTVDGDGAEYWFPVWVVVVDNEPYLRLGSRAAERFSANSTFPEISIRLDGQRFDRVRGEPVPDYTIPVAEAMAEKYWSDFFIRWLPHSMTLRLVRVHEAPGTAPGESSFRISIRDVGDVQLRLN